MRERLSARGLGVFAFIVVVVLAVVGWSVWDAKRDRGSDTEAGETVAAGPAPFEAGRLRFGDPNAPGTLVVIEDYQCPLCKSLNVVSGDAINAAVTEGKAAVEYDIVAVLDGESTTEYSSRAANASACVAVADKEKWRAFRGLVLQRQQPTGSAGLGDAELVELARQAGVADPGLDACVTSGRYRDFVAAHTKVVVAGGLSRVPVVLANGAEVISPTPQGISDALAGKR